MEAEEQQRRLREAVWGWVERPWAGPWESEGGARAGARRIGEETERAVERLFEAMKGGTEEERRETRTELTRILGPCPDMPPLVENPEREKEFQAFLPTVWVTEEELNGPPIVEVMPEDELAAGNTAGIIEYMLEHLNTADQWLSLFTTPEVWIGTEINEIKRRLLRDGENERTAKLMGLWQKYRPEDFDQQQQQRGHRLPLEGNRARRAISDCLVCFLLCARSVFPRDVSQLIAKMAFEMDWQMNAHVRSSVLSSMQQDCWQHIYGLFR